jgi:2-polyprenyl-3-methyl-5-hydroxy-6-metoxy-1,4-benzoquinol methylase
MNVRRLLVARGIYGLILRWGPKKLRAAAFDQKYVSGAWHFPPDDELALVVRNYLRGGDLLLLGCGGSAVLNSLKSSELTSALGIDISEEAIALAARFSSDRISFQVADMVLFECSQFYDVILFSESLYYVSLREQKALLRRFGENLKADGVFVVTVCETTGRYLDLLSEIRRTFHIVEDRSFRESERHLLVFRI